MFSVIFEAKARDEKLDGYFNLAGSLKPTLEQIEGFIENIRYVSLRRGEGWRLSLSSWANEKALVRWRTHAKHHSAQELGRNKILLEYHLRVGQNTLDTARADGSTLADMRLDATEVGAGTTMSLINAEVSPEAVKASSVNELAGKLGLSDTEQDGLLDWDVMDNVAKSGELILLVTWRDEAAAVAFEEAERTPAVSRVRTVRVVRDYGMFDRREAPQYYPDVEWDKRK